MLNRTGRSNDAGLRKAQSAMLVALGVAFALLGVVVTALSSGAIEKSSFAHRVVLWAMAVAIIAPSYIWALLDAVVHDYPFGKSMLVLFLALLPAGLVVYFYWSRGAAGGTVALVKACAFAGLLSAVAVAAAAASSLAW